MFNKFEEELKKALKSDSRVFVGGRILKNKLIELALHLDESILEKLLSSELISSHFFQKAGSLMVFDKVKFQRYVNNKEFLPNSFTEFKNKIGLTINKEYLTEHNEVLLAWPYKDCVLEGGQSNSEATRDEIFWNQTLAPDEVDRLLEPKVISNIKMVSSVQENSPKEISADDNLLIKGNNLIALHSLKRALKAKKRKVKLIYIDPPYNTGNDDFGYNDKFNHASWLTFMKNRLEVAKDLLSDDGSIWINIDDIEVHYLKVLCDEIFQRENFVANVIWQKKFAPQNDAKYFSDNHDHILVYAKNKQIWKPNLLERSEETIARYTNPDGDPRGNWTSGDLTVKTYSPDYDYPITTPSGKVVNPPKGICWRVSKAKFEELVADNRIWFGKEGGNVPRLKRFITDVKEGQTPLTIWLHGEVGHNQEAKQELNKLLETDMFKTPKPERLLKRIIEIGSNAGDLVLDFFAGSGTTAAVAMKLQRRFITIEQMDYVESVTKLRLKKVAAGEQGGISKAVSWSGGGSFLYLELAKANQNLVDRIDKAQDVELLLGICKELENNSFVNYQVSLEALRMNDEQFRVLTLTEQKQLLIEVLDRNMMYVPYSEIDDVAYRIEEHEKKLNHSFYN